MDARLRSARETAIGGVRLRWGERTHLMGIVNATPDSFSGDGLVDPGAAVEYACAQLDAGADIVDIGAESTRPGHRPIDASEELRRLIPVIRGLHERAPDAPISVDTFKPEVAVAAFDAGAAMLNSIWGLDDALLACAVERDAAVVIMHNKRVAVYERDLVDEVLEYLERQALRAVAAGLAPERVILDPGIGFGKMPEHNLAVLGALDRLAGLGFPTLLGISRKSTIGKLTGRDVGDREFGTAATVAFAAAAKIDVVRVHEVAAMKDVVHVADAIARGWRPADWKESSP